MSLIGLLTATEKQVVLGRLHMRPIQWHLKKHWHVPEVLEKRIPLPRSLYPHLQWWLNEDNVLKGQPLHPLQHALQLFADASNKGLGHSHRRLHGKRLLVRLRRPVAHILSRTKSGSSGTQEVRATVLGPDHFGSHGQHNGCLIHQQGGGMRSGSLCALLWRLLPSCNHRQIVLRARHIPGRLNVSGQIVQTQTSDPDRVVPPTGLRPLVCKVAHSSGRSYPGTVTNFPSLCLHYRIHRLGRWMLSA